MRMLFVVMLIAVSCVFPGRALAIEGYPGATWGTLEFEHSRLNDDNLVLDGWIEQGIHWATFNTTKLITYATIKYTVDTRKLDYNNTFGPGLGIALDTYTKQGISLRLGLEYVWEKRFRTDTDNPKVSLYLNWYTNWDLKKKP